jgi:hypothetical protein
MVQEGGNIFVKASVPGVNPEYIDVSMLYGYRILSTLIRLSLIISMEF